MKKKFIPYVITAILVSQAVIVPIANAQEEETKKEEVQPKPEHNPMLALLFGLIIPGGAQFYNGNTDAAIKAFAITVGTALAWTCIAFVLSFTGIGLVLWFFPIYLIPWIWYAYQGYLTAQKIQAGTAMNFYQPESTILTTK
jgi:hypothetical protein